MPSKLAPISAPVHFDFVDLRLFVNVAESTSLTRGAASSALSLAAASTRIKNLEVAVGVQLLYRTKRGVSPTPAGDALLQHARQILSQVRHLGADLQQFSRGVKGHVRIFANTTAVAEFLPRTLGEFLAEHPPVDIDLREYPSAEIVRAVHEGKTDIGIVAGHVGTSGLETLPYFRDRLMLAVPKGHALAKRRSVSFSEAITFDFVGLGASSAMHSFITRIALERGWELRLRIHVGSYDAMCRMIASGVGIGLLAESAARRHAHSTGIRALHLVDDWAIQPLKICVRDLQALPGLARELVQRLVASAREFDDGARADASL
ncbi:MAG: LysR substrate-binding domain-containing protein [Pseudomonadota bacterium]